LAGAPNGTEPSGGRGVGIEGIAGSGGIGGNFGSDKGADVPGVAAADADEKKRGNVKPAAVASVEVLRNLRRVNLVFTAMDFGSRTVNFERNGIFAGLLFWKPHL
jgi:hypothetical protein